MIERQQVDELLAKLSTERRSQVLFSALKKGGKALQQETKVQLRQSVSNTHSPNRWNGKTLEDGIRVKANTVYQEVMIHILGDFRLKFFEKGTKDRYTKIHKDKLSTSQYINYLKKGGKGGYRGRITASHFFRRARQNEEIIQSAIFKELDKQFK